MSYGPGRPKKGETRPSKPKKKFDRSAPRPDLWICGPDPYKHSMYIPWLRAKAQCNFRGEEFTLTFDEFYEIWHDEWPNRGRRADQMCMSRRDGKGAWSKDNVEIITRQEHLVKQGFIRRGQPKKRLAQGRKPGSGLHTANRTPKKTKKSQPTNSSGKSLFSRYYGGVK